MTPEYKVRNSISAGNALTHKTITDIEESIKYVRHKLQLIFRLGYSQALIDLRSLIVMQDESESLYPQDNPSILILDQLLERMQRSSRHET